MIRIVLDKFALLVRDCVIIAKRAGVNAGG